MQKFDVNGALKLLTNNMANGILPLNEETLKLIKQKHPEAQDITLESHYRTVTKSTFH